MDWTSFILNVGITTLLATVKNPKKVLELRSILIKVRDALIALQLGDKGSQPPQALVDAAEKV